MMLYLCWNEHIERQADRRYQVETTHVRDVCTWAGFPEERCNAIMGVNVSYPVRPPMALLSMNGTATGSTSALFPAKFKKIYEDASWPEYYYNTSWKILEDANYNLTIQVNRLLEMLFDFPSNLN